MDAISPQLDLLRFSWWTKDGEVDHEVVLLSIAWFGLLLCTVNGRPILGFQASYGSVCVWIGPLFKIFGRR